MARLLKIILTASFITGPVFAAQMQISCQNPRRSYVVIFDAATKSLRTESAGSKTVYLVEQIESGRNGLIVRGKTVKDGPEFTAYFGENRRIEFADSTEIFQTDYCK